MTTHMTATLASQTGSDCLHHLKSLRSCWENPKIYQTGLAAATDCTPKHQPIIDAYSTSCEAIPGRAAAARGKRHKGRRGGRPAMPSWRRSRGRHGEGHTVRTQLEIAGGALCWRRHLWVCTPSGKAHAGVKIPLKDVWPMCMSTAELRKWVLKKLQKVVAKKKKIFFFLIMTCVTQNLIQGTEYNRKWRQREWRPWRRQERYQKWSTAKGQEKYLPWEVFVIFFVLLVSQ